MDAVAAGYGGPRGRPERVCRTWWILGRGKFWTHRATSEALRTPLSARLPYRVVVGLQSTNLAPNHSSHLRNPPETHRSRNGARPTATHSLASCAARPPRAHRPRSHASSQPPQIAVGSSRASTASPTCRISGPLQRGPEASPAAGAGQGSARAWGGPPKANAAQRSAAFREDPTGRASASVPAATPAPPRRIDHAPSSPPRRPGHP
jgi:hypothetical protein